MHPSWPCNHPVSGLCSQRSYLTLSKGGPETLLGSLKVTQQLEDKKSKLSRFKDKLDQGPGASPPSFPSSCALSFLPVTQEKCI